jgi:hypothetical protein
VIDALTADVGGVLTTCAGDLLEPQPLAVRIAPALLGLALRREVSWQEAAYVLDSVEYFDAREAARWRRTEQLIREFEARRSA